MEKKSVLRKRFLSVRSAFSGEEVKEKSLLIKKKLFLLPEFKKAKTIMFYASTEKEVSTKEMILRSQEIGKQVLLPVCGRKKRELIPIFLTNYEELTPGAFGILEPPLDKLKKRELKEIDLVVVPGVAFDSRGNRLGLGGGYYDTFLAELAPKVFFLGIVFKAQIADELPRNEKDISMNAVLTEENYFSIDRR